MKKNSLLKSADLLRLYFLVTIQIGLLEWGILYGKGRPEKCDPRVTSNIF